MTIFNLLIFIIIIAILIMLMVILFRKKKGVAVVLLASVFIVCLVGVLLYNTVFYNNSDKITITNGNDEEFSINVENHLLQYEYTHAQFSSQLNFNEIQNLIKSQYDNAFLDKELNQFVFIDGNMIYTIELYEHSKFLWSDRYRYLFSANTVGFEWQSDHIGVPFPYKAIDESVEVFDTEMKLKCDYEKVKSYYTSFTNAEFGENTIKLTYDRYKVDLILKDNLVKIEITKD